MSAGIAGQDELLLHHSAERLDLPPLLHGEEASGRALDHACRRAREGCDAGLVTYHYDHEMLEAALVLAPEVILQQAMAMLPLCAVGAQNALGTLCPPKSTVELGWDGSLWLNAGRVGAIEVAASTSDPQAMPDWLVICLTLKLNAPGEEAGNNPDQTTLAEEGGEDIAPPRIVETWVRHCLHWITVWEEHGNGPLLRHWQGLSHKAGDPVQYGEHAGIWMGTDEDFSMLLKAGEENRLVPLTKLLGEIF